MQAQRELSLPEEVTYEDVVSIKANPKQIHARQSQSTEKSPEKAYSHIIAPKDTSSMHHFCVATSEQCLPNPFKGAWNQHHTQQLYGLPNVSVSFNAMCLNDKIMFINPWSQYTCFILWIYYYQLNYY